MKKLNKIHENLTSLTVDYLRTIAGLESTLSVIMSEDEIDRLKSVLDNLEHMSLEELMDVETSYEVHHILLAMWNIYYTIHDSPLMKETCNMLYDLCLDMDEDYEIVWQKDKFVIQISELPSVELDELDESSSNVEELLEE